MNNITIRGVPHFYQWVIKDGNATGQRTGKPVLVFLHGWGGSSRYWLSTAHALCAHFDCLLYDQRGFGESQQSAGQPGSEQKPGPKTPPYQLEAYSEDLYTLLNELQLGQVYLNAHSMGASIAALFMNQYPDRVIKAILTCNGLLEYDEQAFSQFHQFGQYVVKFRPAWLTKIPGMDRLFMARFLSRPIPAAQRQGFLEDFVKADYEAALGTMLAAVSKKSAFEMPGLYRQFQVPTLLVSGEYDQIISAEMGRQAAELNPLVDYTVITNTGHFPMLEDADTYLKAVSQFLQLDPVAA